MKFTLWTALGHAQKRRAGGATVVAAGINMSTRVLNFLHFSYNSSHYISFELPRDTSVVLRRAVTTVTRHNEPIQTTETSPYLFSSPGNSPLSTKIRGFSIRQNSTYLSQYNSPVYLCRLEEILSFWLFATAQLCQLSYRVSTTGSNKRCRMDPARYQQLSCLTKHYFHRLSRLLQRQRCGQRASIHELCLGLRSR